MRPSLRPWLPPSSVFGVVVRGPEVFASLAESPAELVLVDLCLPDLTGRQVVGGLRLLHRELKIAAMFDHDGPDYRESLRGLGANGFLWKGSSFDSFRAGLTEVANGATWIAVPDSFQPGPVPWISDLEHQVLECLADYPIKAIPRRLGIRTRRVETTLQRLRRRFRVRSNIELVREAILIGYLPEAKSA